MVMGRCDPGLKLDRELQVGLEHTAQSLGSGDVPVLGTPALLALAEGACVQAIADDLPDGDTSVGTWAEIEHLRAAPTGSTVCAHATLIGHHGRRLEFSVMVEQDGDLVAKVRHRRVLVDRERFLAKIALHESPDRADRPAATRPPVDKLSEHAARSAS
jgi:fluoroacetyl-CoA thioesterase